MTSTPEEIESLINRYDKEVEQIKTDSIRMVWYMRGGVSYQEIMNMGTAERKMINNIIKENLETTKNSKLPFF
jgi:hypothetical protein